MYLPYADRLRLYRQFKAIHLGDFQNIVSYYEIHEAAIYTLDFDAWFDCTLIYCQALFDAEHYGKHVVMCDYLLHTIMENNIVQWGGEDWYVRILHQKARSLMRLRENKKAEHILQELIKMHPFDQENVRLLFRLRLRALSRRRAEVRAVLVAIVLLIIILMTVETFILRLYPRYLGYFELIHNAMAVIGMSLFLFSEWYHWEKCRRSVRCYVQQAQKQKIENRSSTF